MIKPPTVPDMCWPFRPVTSGAPDVGSWFGRKNHWGNAIDIFGLGSWTTQFFKLRGVLVKERSRKPSWGVRGFPTCTCFERLGKKTASARNRHLDCSVLS